jgi:hypothetical protein
MTNTISTDVTYANGITLGSNGYSGNLTITATGTVQPSGYGVTAIYNSIASYTVINGGAVIGGGGTYGAGGGAGVVLYAGALTNNGTITGGNGGGGFFDPGGAGVVLSAGTLTNDGTITGGNGGGSYLFVGGAGGTGVALILGTLTNDGTITGGNGGGSYRGAAGAGGTGVALTAGTLTNDGTITGGNGGDANSGGGAGGAGVVLYAETLTNDGTITGGSGGYSNNAGGAGGTGVVLSVGTLTNDGTITGGSGGDSYFDPGGAGGAGVVLYAGALTNDGQITGGRGGRDIYYGGSGAGGAGVSLDGGTLINAGTITGSAGADAVQFGTQAATLIVDPGAVFNGAVVAQASVADVLMVAGDASVILDSEFIGFSTLGFAGGSNATITGTAAELASGQIINGFSGGDKIVLENFVESSFTYVAGTGLELTDINGNEVTLDIVEPAGATTGNFTVTDPQAVTTITYTACFAAGTRILRADGRLARVEDLAVGDTLEQFAGTAAPIDWIGVRTLDLRLHPNPANVQPILITRGALGGGLPWRDLVVSPDHAMYLQGHLIPAKALLNGFTVRQLKRTHVTYYHVELPTHAVIFAEGAAAESYLESGNRGAFENGGGAVKLHTDFANSLRLAKSCAPFVEDGPVVEAVRAGILQHAAIAITDDPALSIRYENGAAIINSRAAVPGEMFADPRDRRQLGVKVARLAIGGQMVRLDHPELAEGWHAMEPDGRWTDGRAIIPSGLIPPGSQIVVELAAAMHYPMSSQGATLSKAAC